MSIAGEAERHAAEMHWLHHPEPKPFWQQASQHNLLCCVIANDAEEPLKQAEY